MAYVIASEAWQSIFPLATWGRGDKNVGWHYYANNVKVGLIKPTYLMRYCLGRLTALPLIAYTQHLRVGAVAVVEVPVRAADVEAASVRVVGGNLNRAPQVHIDVILS